MTVDDILDQVKHPHVVITGGEPTIYNLDSLLNGLRRSNSKVYIQLETSGQNELKGFFVPDWITWSPKEALEWKAARDIWRHADEVKWVVDETLDFDTVDNAREEFLEEVPELSLPVFMLMPEGCPPRPEMVDKTLEWLNKRPNWRYSDRLQYRIGVK